MILVCGASLLMWYPERHRNGVVSLLLQRMRDVCVHGKVKLGSQTRSTTTNRVNHDNLMRWGVCIKKNNSTGTTFVPLRQLAVMKSNKKFVNSIVSSIRTIFPTVNDCSTTRCCISKSSWTWNVCDRNSSIFNLISASPILTTTVQTNGQANWYWRSSNWRLVTRIHQIPPKNNPDSVWLTNPNLNDKNHLVENYLPSPLWAVSFWISNWRKLGSPRFKNKIATAPKWLSVSTIRFWRNKKLKCPRK